jgi:hypothetical protein
MKKIPDGLVSICHRKELATELTLDIHIASTPLVFKQPPTRCIMWYIQLSAPNGNGGGLKIFLK